MFLLLAGCSANIDPALEARVQQALEDQNATVVSAEPCLAIPEWQSGTAKRADNLGGELLFVATEHAVLVPPNPNMLRAIDECVGRIEPDNMMAGE